MSEWAHHLASRTVPCTQTLQPWPATCGTGGLQHPKGVYELFSYSLSSLCHWANYVHTLEGAKEGVPTCPAWQRRADLWFIYLQTLQLPAKRRICGRCNYIPPYTTIETSQVPSKTCFMINHFQNPDKPMSIMECPRWFKPWPLWDGENVTVFKELPGGGIQINLHGIHWFCSVLAGSLSYITVSWR